MCFHFLSHKTLHIVRPKVFNLPDRLKGELAEAAPLPPEKLPRDRCSGRGGSNVLLSARKPAQSGGVRGVRLAGAGPRAPFLSGRHPWQQRLSTCSHFTDQEMEAPSDVRREPGMVLTHTNR